MFNRSIFAQKTNSLPKQQTSPKPISNVKQLASNKINIRRCSSNQSILRFPTDKKLVKVIPQSLQFESTEPRQLYEIPFFVRNESSELQKVRIIPPVKKQFKIKFADNFNNQIAAGLAVKVSVFFCSEDQFEMIEDKIIIMGNSFKEEVVLVASAPRSCFVFPKVLNVGSLVVKQQKKIEISIKNTGSKIGMITIEDIRTSDYCPNISYPNKSITVLPGKTEFLEINVKPSVSGELQIKVQFSSMDSCTIKSIVLDDQVQIVDENGIKVSSKDFGELFISERLNWSFFIANSTQNTVQSILQTLNKKKSNTDIKIDKKRNIFISQTSPQQFSASVQTSCLSLEKNQMQIKPFSSEKNTMYVQKVPTKEQIDIFVQNLTRNIQSSIYKAEHSMELNRSLAVTKDPNEIDFLLTGPNNKNNLSIPTQSKILQKDKIINETLAVKFSSQEKIFKIPIKFCSKIPNLEINLNSIEFGKLFVKEAQERQFKLKNLSSKPIKLNFGEATTAFKENFKIQGPQVLNEMSESKFRIKFRPLIKKRFAQILKIKVFDHFPIEIKIFGECLGLDGNNMKNQMSLTMRDRTNETMNKTSWRGLLKDKTSRQFTDRGNEFTLNRSLNKTAKLTQSTNLLLSTQLMSKTKRIQKSDDQQIAKVIFSQRQQNMSSQKLAKQSLFFKKEEFLTSTRKNKPFNHPSNLRELLRYQGLSLQELKKIEVQEQKLEFGHIFVGSRTTKKLTIKNKLQHPVLIELDTQGADALSQNSNNPIRLQGFGTYEANIVLHPTQLGQLQLPLNYIINKQHVFEVKILAMVTLVNVELSARSFAFNFNEEDPQFQKEATLQVYNNGNKKAKFMFDQPQNPSFKLSVLQGELEPKSSLNIKIVYSPFNGHESGQQRVDVQKLKMKVQDGAQNIIKCTGTVKQPKISIKQTEFINENSVVSVPICNKITIKNLSKVSTYVKVQFEPVTMKLKAEEISEYISIQNSVYLLAGDDKKEILFSFLSHEPKKIDMNVIVSIRGYNIVKIPFSVNILSPEITCQFPQINFQDVPIMSNHCIEMFSLTNKTQAQIKLEIDPTYPKEEYFCEILAVKDKNLDLSFEDEKYRTFLNSFMASFRDNRRQSKRRSIVCNKILTLPPGEQSIFNFKFVPKCIMKYDFQLPLRIFGCSQKVIKPVDLQIKCNAVQPVIYVEPRAIKFDMKVINEAKTSYSQSIFISNPHNYQARFKIQPLMRNSQPLNTQNKKNILSLNSNAGTRRERTSSRMQSILSFSFSQFEGEIEPNGKIEIFVMFKASCEGEFLEKYTIFLGPKTEEIKALATSVSSYILDVSGSAIMPTLRFSCNQAIMPVVPLNLESRIFVMIQNHGYDAITICKWKTSNHFQHTDIKVNFIEGKLLSLAKKSLRVEIVFSSLAPISFTTMLEFYDEYGNKYELPLSCTADNSIFTCFPYLESDNQQTILYNFQEKLIKIMPTGKNSYYETPKHLSGSHTMTCNFIQKWINFQLNMNIKTYPQSLIQSEGKDFAKLINRISSKNIIKRNEFTENVTEQDDDTVSENNQKSNTMKIISLVQLYSETIKKLKQQGAFLNQIRPQFLLNYSQFIVYQNFKRKLVCSQTIFEVISVESWITLFYQLCKIYVQPQITQKILSKIKIDPSPIPANVTSNLYSPVEITLLKFINFYLASEDGSGHQPSLLINLTEHIKIFEVIHRLLENCFKLSLTEQISTLKNSVSIMSPHVYLSSIAKFLYTQLKEFGLSAYLNSTDLFSIGVKELTLYLINLMQMVYHYTNASLIKFQGAVGDKITKVIELENPTSKKVNYFVKIVNHNGDSSFDKDPLKTTTKLPNSNDIVNKNLALSKSSSTLEETSFVAEMNQITIGPRQKAQLKVVYRCKNAKGENANLYLIPTKEDEDYTIPQPLMFKLTTTILSKILMKKINVTTALYEVLPIHLDIQLPSQIPESAEFNLSLFQQTSPQESNNQFFTPPSFIFSQSHARTLKEGNKDSFEIKLIPMSLGDKMCKISYFSSLYGEFIYQIHAKITNPKIVKQFKFKDLKVNVEEEVTITINRENDVMNSILKIYYPELHSYHNHNRTEKHLPTLGSTKKNLSSSSKFNISMIERASARDLKYEVEIIDNPYVTLMKGYNIIEKLQKENKIVLKTNFTKPYKEFSVTLSVKNQLLKDHRFYKVSFVVISPPKIIKMQLKTSAREPIIQKIPVKINPCEVTLKSNCDCFTIENLNKEYFNNTDLICHFNPQWVQEKQAVLEIQNKESLEQIIYEISLKAQEPEKFGTFELMCSSLFNEEVSIPIDVQTVFSHLVQEESKSAISSSTNFTTTIMNSKNLSGIFFDIKRLFKRAHSIQSDKFYPFLQPKNMKSLTGIKMNESFMLSKETSEKLKAPKTRSLVDDRSIRSINMVLHPSDIENETGSIRLAKPNSQQYYWAKVVLKNRPVKKLKPVRLQQKLNQIRVEPIDKLATEEGIDFNASDFEFKFSSQQKYLRFSLMQVENNPSQILRSLFFSSKQKRPCLVFNPLKQIQTEQTLYFKSNNQEFMLPVLLRAEPMPTILVPEITTINIEPKTTCINLINSSEEAGVYKVVIFNHDDPSSQSWTFVDSEEYPSCDWIESDPNNGPDGMMYFLKPKQKKEIKVCFKPKYIHQKEKFIVKFESQTLPNYTYILNGRSEFKIEEENAEFEVYEDHIRPFHINFSNLFQRKQYFSVDLQMTESKQQNSKIEEFIKIQEPVSRKFDLQQGEFKGILLSIKDTYFKESQQMIEKKSQQNSNESNFKFVVSLRVGEKVVKKYHITLLVIKNLFSQKNKKVKVERARAVNKHKTRLVFDMENDQQKQTFFRNRNFYHWSCKARETIYETIELPEDLNLCVKEIKCAPQISKYISFTCISQSESSSRTIGKDKANLLKIKYSPMKPIKKKKYDFILIGTNGQKYRIECEISVQEPPIDDTIIIKTTELDQTGCVSFKLTNTAKCSAKYRAHFMKNLPEFSVETDHGVLEGYGKPGTPIMVNFRSHINNRRLEDRLIIETDDMYWCFKVKGMLSKDGH